MRVPTCKKISYSKNHMDPAQQEFNLFIRRWQVRLCIAAFTSPAAIFILIEFVFDRSSKDTGIVCAVMGGSFLFAAAMLQAWCFEKKKKKARSPEMMVDPREY